MSPKMSSFAKKSGQKNKKIKFKYMLLKNNNKNIVLL